MEFRRAVLECAVVSETQICGKLDCIVKVIPIILRFMCIRTECENFTAQFVISSQYGFPRQPDACAVFETGCIDFNSLAIIDKQFEYFVDYVLNRTVIQYFSNISVYDAEMAKHIEIHEFAETFMHERIEIFKF